MDLISRLRALDTSVKATCSVTGAPGLSLGVAQEGKIIHIAHFGFRDVEKQILADSNTIYGVASLTNFLQQAPLASLSRRTNHHVRPPLNPIMRICQSNFKSAMATTPAPPPTPLAPRTVLMSTYIETCVILICGC